MIIRDTGNQVHSMSITDALTMIDSTTELARKGRTPTAGIEAFTSEEGARLHGLLTFIQAIGVKHELLFDEEWNAVGVRVNGTHIVVN